MDISHARNRFSTFRWATDAISSSSPSSDEGAAPGTERICVLGKVCYERGADTNDSYLHIFSYIEFFREKII
jgi:hypothetical protein